MIPAQTERTVYAAETDSARFGISAADSHDHTDFLISVTNRLIPQRTYFCPSTEAKDADLATWRAFVSILRREAKRAGWLVQTTWNEAGTASWYDIWIKLSKEDGSTAIEMLSMCHNIGNERSLIVRQLDKSTGFSGPNHSIGLRTIEDALKLATSLSALPFNRDQCNHCGKVPL